MCLEILAGYGVVPRALQILWTYWYRLTMVSKAGGYYGPLFKGYRSVTQGDTLSPMIFNVVVGSIIHHWVMMVATTDPVAEGLSALVQGLEAYFCVDEGLVMPN